MYLPTCYISHYLFARLHKATQSQIFSPSHLEIYTFSFVFDPFSYFTQLFDNRCSKLKCTVSEGSKIWGLCTAHVQLSRTDVLCKPNQLHSVQAVLGVRSPPMRTYCLKAPFTSWSRIWALGTDAFRQHWCGAEGWVTLVWRVVNHLRR